MDIYNPDGTLLIDIFVDDNSYRHREIMGEDALTLYFSLAEHVEIPLGAYVDYSGMTYTLTHPQSLTMHHSRNFEYTAIFEAPQSRARLYKFRNPVDGRLKFTYTAQPREHLQMFVDNMNRRDAGWAIGECVDGTEKMVSYDHDYCWDALGKMASEFDTEFEIDGKTVSLHKVEYNRGRDALPLSYGKGNGFLPDVGRTNASDDAPVEILFAQGGDRNIDLKKYDAKELHLPKDGIIAYDGEHFDDEDGFNADAARTYAADASGLSLRNAGRELQTLAEDSLDCSEYYPKRVGEVTSVVVVNEQNNLYDFIDGSIPDDLDYSKCLIAGSERMTVVFQSGELAGREFEAVYHHNKIGEVADRRFEIVPQEIDGVMMPGGSFVPRQHDKYAVFNVMLPQAYINACQKTGDPKQGGEWDMMRAAVKYLYEHEDRKFTFSGTLDGIWARRDWANIGGKIRLGGYVLFTDPRFQPQGVEVRIVGIKDYINLPHSPEIELSNETVTGSFGSQIKQLESQAVVNEQRHREAVQFTRRAYADARQTMTMLQQAFNDRFTNAVSPVTVNTMSMLVGDERLQFAFVADIDDPRVVDCPVIYNSAKGSLTVAQSTIKHYTLDIDTLSCSHSDGEYHYWQMPAFSSGALFLLPTKAYYLYAVVRKEATEQSQNTYRLSSESLPFEGDGCYSLLVGILNSEYEGTRSFVPVFGFTEILPGRITADRIANPAGTSYFDMVNDAFALGDALQFNVAGDGKLRLKGTLVQSLSGDDAPIGCYRGEYRADCQYFKGDEVTYSVNGVASTYRFVYSTPAIGIAPTDTLYWQILAQGVAGAKGDKGEKGDNGTNGSDGKSPALVYRGEYDSTATYYGNDNRRDCVHSGNAFYIAALTAGEFAASAPPSDKWQFFGGNFESVATQLLLAEGANIANLLFNNQRLETAAQGADGTPNFYIDGLNNTAKIGWLILQGLNLVGYDSNGVERLRLTPENLPPANAAGETSALAVVSWDAMDGVWQGGATATEVAFSKHMQVVNGNDSDASAGIFDNTLAGAVYYNVTAANTKLKFGLTQVQFMPTDLHGHALTNERTRTDLMVRVQSVTGSGSSERCTDIANINLANANEVTVPNAGRIKVTFAVTGWCSAEEWMCDCTLAAQAVEATTVQSEVIIARDGIMAIYNDNYLRMHSTQGFVAKVGNNSFSVTSSGIKYTVAGTEHTLN